MSTVELDPRRRAVATKRKRSISRTITAARSLFDEHGYYEVRLVDIARESGVSTATIDTYFPTKQAVALGAYAPVLLTIVDRAETALVNETEAGAVMAGFIRELAVAAVQSPALAVALLPASRDLKSSKTTLENDEIIVVDFDQPTDLLGRLLVSHWRNGASFAETASDTAELFLLGLLSRIVKHPEQPGIASDEILLAYLL